MSQKPNIALDPIKFRNEQDAQEFFRLCDEARQSLRRRHRAVISVLKISEQIKNGAPGLRRWLSITTEYHATTIGLSKKRLQNLCSEFQEDRDWRVLLDTAKWKLDGGTNNLPAEFLAEIRKRHAHTSGGFNATYRKLVADWLAWRRGDSSKAIPGYDLAPPPAPGSPVPSGWSINNLRKHALSDMEKEAMHRGLGAARKFLPQVLTSRRDLLVGQRWELDDYEPDVQVLHGVGTRRQICVPLQFAAMDVHSGCVPLYRFKPAYKREGDITDKWKGPHAALFVITLLATYGFDQQHGTVIPLEGGTMTLDDPTIEHIRSIVGDKVRFEFPPDRTRAQVMPWQGRSGGNPNKKPHIESWHNLLTRALSDLPGQKGANYLKAPEFLHGQKVLQERTLKQAAELAEQGKANRAALLLNEFLDFDKEFIPTIAQAIERINDDRDHDLEGWDPYVVPAFRLCAETGHWLTRDQLAQLPQAEQLALMERIALAPAVHSGRIRLSRSEVFRGQLAEGYASGRMQRLTPWEACELIAGNQKAAEAVRAIRPRSLNRSYIVVEDTRLALLPEPQIYEARVRQPDGNEIELPEGDYQIVFNAFAPQTVFVCKPGGGFLGVASKAERHNPNDLDAILEAWGHAGSRRAERLQPVRTLAADTAREVANRKAHNARVLAGKAITDEERADRRALNRQVAKVTDDDRAAFITDAPADHPTPASTPGLDSLI